MTEEHTTVDVNQEDSLLSFFVGPYYFCVPAISVESMITPPKISAIPLSPNSVVGMFPHRGDVAIVIDLRKKFGLPERQEGATGQLILSKLESGLKAFWVDEILETSATENMDWRPASQLIKCECFEKFALKEKDVILYTTFELLFAANDSELASLLKQLNKDDDSTDIDSSENTHKAGEANTKTSSDSSSDNSLDSFLTSDNTKNTANESAENTEPNNQHNSNEENLDYTSSTQSEATTPKAPDNVLNTGQGFQQTSSLQYNNANTHAPSSAGTSGTSNSFKKPAHASHQERSTQTSTRAGSSRAGFHQTGHYKSPQEQAYHSAQQNSASNTYTSSAQRTHGQHHSQQQTGQYDSPQRHSEGSGYQLNPHRELQDIDTKENENKTGIIISLLALLLLVPFLLWWLWPEDTKKDDIPIATTVDTYAETDTYNTHEEQAYQAGPAVEEIIPDDLDSTPVHDQPVAKEIYSETTIIENTATSSSTYEQPTDSYEEPVTSTVTSNDSGEIYQLETNDFSITVERPDNDSNIPLPIIDSNSTPVEQKTEKTSNIMLSYEEFTHKVVKGDTLWHIAIRYLGDPYKYPKLARLSLIKNPDLIYPGDIVRITRKIKTTE